MQTTVSSVSSHVWEVDRKGYLLGLGCLIPGRSKKVPISDPRAKENPRRDTDTGYIEDSV